MIEEDNPPNEYERKTVPPAGEVDARMVQLALSSMATTLEQIQKAVSVVPELVRTVGALERQHEVTMRGIEEARGVANLAGGIAAAAREEIETVRQSCERIEHAVGRLAQSMQGLDERSRSLYDAVFPERDGPPSDVDLADVVSIRRNVMTGE